MLNILTIDVEDYFQVHAFSKCIRYQDWETYESRVERNTERLLEILGGVKATFFVLGWIAQRYPGLVRKIKEQGHEIASHGCDHQLVSSMSPDQFREDVRRSKSILEDIIGEAIIGYRAPNYSIGYHQLWALQILAEEGYRYDSSIYPIHHDTYGIPDAPRFPFVIPFKGNGDSPLTASDCARKPYADSLIEFPLSTVRIGNLNIPMAGGGYFRLFPYDVVRRGLRRINRREERPFIFFLHPWEVDPEQPRIRGALMKSRFRHYLNLRRTERRFEKLVRDFPFSSAKEVIERDARPLTGDGTTHRLFEGLAPTRSDPQAQAAWKEPKPNVGGRC
jgi:polysaccharide deacetylase family protein (PEP-CTERM system associated)